MSFDPRVQKFYDEAAAAKKELRRLAIEIAAHRIDYADSAANVRQAGAIASAVVQEMTWALENGRTDLAARLIELIDQYNNSTGTAIMMQARVNAELHQKAVQAREEGDEPEYLDEDEEADVIRLSPEQAQAVFSPVNRTDDE